MAIHIRILVTSLSLWVLECCHAATSSHGPSLDSHDAYARADQGDVQKLDFSFTEDTHIDNEDAYICIPVEFPSEEGFVIKYEQFFDPTYVHHALLFGCPEPLDTKQWYVYLTHAMFSSLTSSLPFGLSGLLSVCPPCFCAILTTGPLPTGS
jgi:hypothetical protein